MPKARTSASHPLRVAAVAPGDGHGRIGITLCPGKTDPAGIRDRALGAFLGLAIGDAVGTTLEFRSRDAQPRLQDMTSGGPFALPPGAWTDDTAMALALADSLAASGTLDGRDLMDRFTRWWRNGEYSCTGACFDIGNATRAALDRYVRTADPFAGSTHPRTAGNGSLMRLAPVALRFGNDPSRLVDTAAEQSRTTHGAEEAVDACRAFAELLAEAIAGSPRAALLAPRRFEGAAAVAGIMVGSWRGRPRNEIRSSGIAGGSRLRHRGARRHQPRHRASHGTHLPVSRGAAGGAHVGRATGDDPGRASDLRPVEGASRRLRLHLPQRRHPRGETPMKPAIEACGTGVGHAGRPLAPWPAGAHHRLDAPVQ